MDVLPSGCCHLKCGFLRSSYPGRQKPEIPGGTNKKQHKKLLQAEYHHISVKNVELLGPSFMH